MMVFRTITRRLVRSHLEIRWRCSSLVLSRCISQAYLQKKADAEKQWQAKAGEIRAGKVESMLSILEKRGYVDSIAG
jgi:hypothetical protein